MCGPSELNWNHQLRLIVDGRVKQKTNIVELVEHLLYPERKGVDTPNGFDMFVDGLSRIGLESHWVRNEYAKEKLDENERMYDTNSSDESDNESEHESNENSDCESNHESNDDQETNERQDEDCESNHESNDDQETNEQETNNDQEMKLKEPINWTIFSDDESDDGESDDGESEQECRLSSDNKNFLNRHRKHGFYYYDGSVKEREHDTEEDTDM